MAYNEFTFDMLEEQFGLTVTEVSGLFASTQPLPLTDYFRMQLARHRPLVVGVDTEKVRSELLIAPMLVELREQVAHSVGLFSGAEFNVDRESGLVGFCDFLVSRTPGLVRIGVPVLTVVEAKRESLTGGTAAVYRGDVCGLAFQSAARRTDSDHLWRGDDRDSMAFPATHWHTGHDRYSGLLY